MIDLSRPQNQKDLESFLSLLIFLHCLSKVMDLLGNPLTALFRKDVPFDWNKETGFFTGTEGITG